MTGGIGQGSVTTMTIALVPCRRLSSRPTDGIDATLSKIAEQAAQFEDPAASARAEAARVRIAECDAEIGQYRASLKAGADPAVIGPWIAEAQAKKVAAQAEVRSAGGRAQMSQEEIAAVVTAYGDLARLKSPPRNPGSGVSDGASLYLLLI